MFKPIIICDKCQQEFNEIDAHFYFNRRKGKHYTWCKDCHKGITAKKHKVNRQRPLSADPIEDKFIRLRRRLVARNKYADEVLSTKELIELHKTQQGKCAYTGLEYSLTEKGPLCMTIDRIDNTRGYSIDNVALCCWFVNCAKNQWPLEQMKQLWKHLPTI